MKMFERHVDEAWDFPTANTKEYTHCYHTYPAMMIPQVARTLMQLYAPDDGVCNRLFDPYMGSGTSLVEASMLGIETIGTDINPLARLLSEAKTTHFDVEEIEKVLADLQVLSLSYSPDAVLDKDFSRISNYGFWYSEEVLLRLSFLTQYIASLDSRIQLFFKVPLSEVVRETSFTRNSEFKRFRMAEEKVKSFRPDVFRLFEEKVERNLRGLKEYNAIEHRKAVVVADFNTVHGIPTTVLPDSAVDMVVTSPPYGDSRTTVAYGQFSRWSNEWFGLPNAKNIDNLLMGGAKQHEAIFETASIVDELRQIQQIDSRRYMEVVAFLNDYYCSIRNIAPVVRSGGRVCYVVGNRNVKGVQIPLDYFTAEMFEKHGFDHLTTIVRRIPNKRMPSMTSPTNKAGAKVATMSNEYIVVMCKR